MHTINVISHFGEVTREDVCVHMCVHMYECAHEYSRCSPTKYHYTHMYTHAHTSTCVACVCAYVYASMYTFPEQKTHWMHYN